MALPALVFPYNGWHCKEKLPCQNKVTPGSIVFYDAVVLLGTPGVSQTEKDVRLVGYQANGKTYWIDKPTSLTIQKDSTVSRCLDCKQNYELPVERFGAQPELELHPEIKAISDLIHIEKMATENDHELSML